MNKLLFLHAFDLFFHLIMDIFSFFWTFSLAILNIVRRSALNLLLSLNLYVLFIQEYTFVLFIDMNCLVLAFDVFSRFLSVLILLCLQVFSNFSFLSFLFYVILVTPLNIVSTQKLLKIWAEHLFVYLWNLIYPLEE